jgi:small GTP-binding protein
MEDNKTEPKTQVKLMLLGNQAVGKSSLMLRYTDDLFNTNMMGTAGIDIKKKVVRVDDVLVKVMIYDTAGHDRFRSITQKTYKGAKGIVLVYDVSDRSTFESVSEWMEHIKAHAESDVQVILVGNKMDIINKQVNEEDGIQFAKKYNVLFMETSALTGNNVETAFGMLLQGIINKDIEKVRVTTDMPEKKQQQKVKSRCCG